MSRADVLRSVYSDFDYDNDDTVGEEEMLALGQARRHLGHKSSPWTKAENDRLLAAMKMNRKTKAVSMDDFVLYWDEKLPVDREAFNATVAEFRHAASHLTVMKDEEVKEGKREAPKPREEEEPKPPKEAAAAAGGGGGRGKGGGGGGGKEKGRGEGERRM